MITRIDAWETSDGQVFRSYDEAERHETRLKLMDCLADYILLIVSRQTGRLKNDCIKADWTVEDIADEILASWNIQPKT